MTKSPASRLIDQRIRELGGWRGQVLARMRALILQADPAITEEWKWQVPVWSRDGIVCTGEAYTRAVKLTFARGASVPDPSRLFNASLGGNARRAIDIREGEQVDAAAFKALIRAAVACNAGRAPRRRATSRPDPRVTAYIAGRAPFARPILKHLRKLIRAAAPEIEEAIKWGMPAFVYRGKIVCGIAGFKAHCALWFWKGRAVVGRKAGAAMGQFGRITRVADLPPAATLQRYVRRAVARIDAAAG